MTEDVCECCGSDGIMNRNLPPEDQAPIWTIVEFRGEPSSYGEGLIYFHKRVCTDCSNRWQLLLLDDSRQERTA